MQFQQDGATSHTANGIINFLETKFGERVISQNGTVGGPPRYCDLTPLDYFLWGYVKSMVYANKPATIDELRTNIGREIAAVSADLCLKIVKNWVQRLQACPWWSCKRNRGFIHNGIERSYTGINNFIDIQNRFVLFNKTFVALLLKNLLLIYFRTDKVLQWEHTSKLFFM